MKRFWKTAGVSILSIALALGVVSIGVAPQPLRAQGPQQTTGTTTVLPIISPTLTGQTFNRNLGGGMACVMIEQFSTTATTFTFAVNGSIDRGVHYFPLAVAPYVGSATIASVLTTVTISNNTATLYTANVSGFTNIQVVTSGTFTATGVNIQITSSTGDCSSRI
jgi:hypothetical protein